LFGIAKSCPKSIDCVETPFFQLMVRSITKVLIQLENGSNKVVSAILRCRFLRSSGVAIRRLVLLAMLPLLDVVV
jgi:hypothetical protein